MEMVASTQTTKQRVCTTRHSWRWRCFADLATAMVIALTVIGMSTTLAIMAPAATAQDTAQDTAQGDDDECPTVEEMTNDSSAIVTGQVIDVRTGGTATAGNEEADDSIILEVIGIEKGGAQNPLAVFYPGEDLPDISNETELQIFLTYDLETARAESTLSCGFTLRSNGDAVAGGASSGESLGETAGETLTEAVQTAGLAGAAVIAVTLIWRVFREFRPRLS